MSPAAPRVYDRAEDLPEGLLASCRPMPAPRELLMCAPDEFQVLDVKNPHMAAHVGKTDREAARRQWEVLKGAFAACGVPVRLIPPTPGCEDMVFCANQTLPGLDAAGRKVCVLSNMLHPSRQREVPAFARWFEAHGYRVERIPASAGFEGSGDALWHPGRALLWGGCGFRSRPEAYEPLADLFGVPVLRLPLRSERFYHLDTCLCAVDERTALVHPAALAPDGLALVRRMFRNVIECDDAEALEGMACNAAAVGGKVVLQQGNRKTVAALRALGYEAVEVDTAEYLKSGGSVFCLKMYVF